MTPGTPPAEETATQRVLWSHIDGQRQPARLVVGPSDPDEQTGEVAYLDLFAARVDLNRDAVRRLRHACDRLLSAGDVRLTDAQLERAAQMVSERVDAAAHDVERLTDALGLHDDPDPLMAGVLRLLAVLTREVGILASGVGRVP